VTVVALTVVVLFADTPLGIDPLIYLVFGAWLTAWLIYALALWRRADPHAGLPRFDLGPAIKVLALDRIQFGPLSGAPVKRRTEKTGWAARLSFLRAFVTGTLEVETEVSFENAPVDVEVHHRLGSLLKVNGLVNRALSYAPGARRWRRCVGEALTDAVLRRYAAMGPNRLVLISGRWHVLGTERMNGAGPDTILLQLREVLARVAGGWQPVAAPEDAWITVECPSAALTALGRREIAPEGELDLDVLATTGRAPADGCELKVCLIVAFQRYTR
jgi:hypothetical protein